MVLQIGGSADTSSGVLKEGVWIPSGWGQSWKAKRDASASTLCEFVAFGDSTTFGSSDSGTATPWFSWVQELRTQAQASGYADGGRGIIAGDDDIATTNNGAMLALPDVGDPVTSNGFTASGQNGVRTSGDWQSSTPGAQLVLSVRCTKFRVKYSVTASPAPAPFTVSVDGGAATTITPSAPADNLHDYADSYVVSGLSDTTHTITITHAGTTGQYVIFCVEALRSTGIVFHKYGTSGASMASYFPITNPTQLNFNAATALGLDTTQTSANGVSWGLPKATGSKAHNIGAAAIHLGINNVQGAAAGGSTSIEPDLIEGVGLFARLCLAGGIDPIVIIPHIESATNAHYYGGRCRAALIAAAQGSNCAIVDFGYPLGPTRDWNALGYGSGAIGGPHLRKLGYQKQAQHLWNNLLALTTYP